MPARPTTKAAVGGGLAGAAAFALAMAVAGIKPDEGKRLVDYADLAGIPTACYGHTGPDVQIGRKRTEPECEAMLNKDVQRHQLGIVACVPALADKPVVWAASTRLAYNMGVTAFCRSGAASAFRRGEWGTGCDLFLPWDKARVKGRLTRINGLSLRRQRERALCLKGLT